MSEETPYQTHDKFFIKSMSDPKVARDFFESYLPDEIKKIANLDTLSPKRDTYVDAHLKKRITDILYAVEMNGRPGYFYILVEHQRSADPLMPLRLMIYIFRIIEQHLKEHKGSKVLPLIFPIVLYNGDGQYQHTTDIFELFGENVELARKVFLSPFKLLDLNEIPDDELKDKAWASVLLLCLKHVNNRGDLLSWFDIITPNLKVLLEHAGLDHVLATLTYLLANCEIGDEERFYQTLHKELSPIEENIMSYASKLVEKGRHEGRQKGWQEGLEKGHQEGHQEGIEKMVVGLLREGALSVEKISCISGLTTNRIQALCNKHCVH